MKHLFIINPAAGPCDRTVQLKAAVEAVFGSRGLAYEIQVTKGPGDDARLAKAAAETGEELRIYACGGDGTLNGVVNGVAGFDNVSVTHYPAGSGNDFVKIFDQPEAFRDLERLLDSEEAAFDLIECVGDEHTCYSLNICSVGLDARIGTEIDAYRRLPLVGGKGAYILSTLVNVVKGTHQPFVISVNGEKIDSDQTLICVCNGRCYGGSFNPVPDAEVDDGLLDVLVIKPVNLLQVAAIIGKYQKGQYRDYPDLIRAIRCREITIESPELNVVNLDGEALMTQNVTFRVSEHRLRFFYPAGLRYRAAEKEAETVGAV